MVPVLLSVAVLAGIGASILALAPRPADRIATTSIERVISGLGAAVIAGAAAAMSLGSTLAVLGLSIPVVPEMLLLLVTVAGIALRAAWRGGRLAFPRFRAIDPASAARQLAAGAILAAAGVVWVRACSLHPNQIWDSVVMWGAKSRAFYYGHGIRGPIFSSGEYRELHQDYPVGVPVLESIAAGFGEPVARGAIGLLALLPPAAAGAFYGALRQRTRAWAAAAVTGTFLGMPLLLANSASGLADAVVASFLLVAATAAWRWLEDADPGWLTWMAAAGSGLVLTKAEGAPLLGVLVVATAAAAVLRRRRPWPLAVALLVPAASLIPWEIWVRLHHIPPSFVGGGGLAQMLARPGGMARVAVAIVRSASHPNRFGFVWPAALLLGTWRAIRRGAEQPFFWMAFVLSTAAFVVVDGLDAGYLIATALDRELIDVSAILVVWIGAGATVRLSPHPVRAVAPAGGSG